MATIILRTKTSKIEFETDIYFDPVDLPYMCMMGYRSNCTSVASAENIENYWNLIDNFFLESNLNTNDYVTLETIIHNDERYGI